MPASSAIVRAYHQRTKHRFEAYAAGPEALDWDDQPAAFRHFEGASQIALPRLGSIAPGSALHAALQQSFGELGAADQPVLPLGLDTLGALLQLSLGITAWKSFGPDRWAVRANPSSGNLHPTEAYLLVGGIVGLADGLYHYRPENHALELRAAHVSAAAKGPQLGILLTSVMWREAWKYGERAFRYCQLDTGHAAAALRYAAAVLGWTLAEQSQVGSATLARLAGVDRSADFPFRRQAETEREEAEILLKVGAGGTAIAPWPVAGLQALADGATWQGVASMVDRHPMYRWPVIDEVAMATRHGDRDAISSPALPAAPLAASPTNTPAVAALLTSRRSAQRFDGRHVMGRDAFAAMLARLRPVAGLPWDAFAGTPRAALAFFVHRVEGLTPGLYLLPRGERQLAALRPLLAGRFALAPVANIDGLLHLVALAPMELQRIGRSLHCHQDIAANACFALGMLTEFDAALVEDSDAYRRLYRECGLIGQVLYLQAEAHGLRGTGIGCFFDDPVHSLLGLEGSGWQTLYHFTVGLPVEDGRIETTPAYADDTAPESTPTEASMNAAEPAKFLCISAVEAAALLRAEPTATVFDVRDVASYQRGCIDGAMHLTEDRVAGWIRRLPKEAPVLIYCYRGNSSKTYAQMFIDFRYSRVFSVDGGYEPLATALAGPAADAVSAGPGSEALAAFLADWGFDAADLNAPRLHGLTPLMRAALDGKRELVRELILLGADIHIRNHDGNTALWLACVSRDKALVQDLIDAGINLNNRNDAGATALMYTASSDRPELLALLLDAGADPSITNFDDMRAVELVASAACLKLLRHTAV